VLTAPKTPALMARRLLMVASQVEEFTSDETNAKRIRQVAQQLKDCSATVFAGWEVCWDIGDAVVAIDECRTACADNKVTQEWAEDTCELLRGILANLGAYKVLDCVDAAILGTPTKCAACGRHELGYGWVIRPTRAFDRVLVRLNPPPEGWEWGAPNLDVVAPAGWGQPVVIDAPACQSLRTYSFGYRVHASCLEKATKEVIFGRRRDRIRQPLFGVLLFGIAATLLLGLFLLDPYPKAVKQELAVGLLLAVLLIGVTIVGIVRLEDPFDKELRKMIDERWRKHWETEKAQAKAKRSAPP
jgi:hypothetical protein